MSRSRTVMYFALVLAMPVGVGAQAAPPPAINVLRIYRETVKPGKAAAHDLHENAWAAALATAKYQGAMLAVQAMTGPSENWYMTGFANWAEVAKADKAGEAFASIDQRFSAKEDQFLSDGRMMVLTRREDLSYGAPADLASSRYFSVTRVLVRPGHNDEYEWNRKRQKAAHEAANLPDAYSMWQVASGAPSGTYYIITALKSLDELDQNAAIHRIPAYVNALGDSTARNTMTANFASAVASSQTDLFAFAPQQSIPAKEWIDADPGYWKRKPAPAKAQ